MRNVRIEATGETGLCVEVTLGGNLRKTHLVAGGDAVDLSVEGNQKLTVSASNDAAPTAEAEIEVGVDVSDAPSENGSGESGEDAPPVDINDLAANAALNVGEGLDNPFAEKI